MLSTGCPYVADIALLGLETMQEETRARARPVEGLRALVHGHWPVMEVETVRNRWNIDTGAGIGHRQRLSILEVNAAEMNSWTFDVDESKFGPGWQDGAGRGASPAFAAHGPGTSGQGHRPSTGPAGLRPARSWPSVCRARSGGDGD